MNILNLIRHYAAHTGELIAVETQDQKLTYGQLDDLSDRMASWIQETCEENKSPVVVYGHKSVYMLVCFLAAVKSGRPYCPLDISIPASRVFDTIEAVNPSVVFLLEETDVKLAGGVTLDQVKAICGQFSKKVTPDSWVKEEDAFYIIFTSGSTGTPKGVQITANCLNHYLEWSVTLGRAAEEKQGKVFLNQAPFSFDLSVMDLYTCLASGGRLYLLDKEVQLDFKLLLPALEKSNATIWVSTPSFVDMCMVDRKFSHQLMPNIDTFLFCGETLTNTTALKLMERFPNAKIMNTYGPTESTVAVTEVEITKALAETVAPLPVGSPKPGTWIEIHREDGSAADVNESGEIIIVGDTVSTGYFMAPELTARSFFTIMKEGRTYRAYKTGDKGCLDESGMLHYSGRMDLQIKLNGYRIEIEDIEKNLTKLKDISQAVVIPKMKEGKVKSLTAFVTGNVESENNSLFSKEMKEKLKAYLPAYMIPKKIVYIDSLPMNNNGKVDRKQLGGLA